MTHTQIVDQLLIKSANKFNSNGVVFTSQANLPCKLGHGGIGQKRGEGDGITPVGNWLMSYFLYRPDRISKPRSYLDGFAFGPNDSWCDLPDSRRYNQPLDFKMPNSSEALWREDQLYDLIIVLNHNTLPAIGGKGSAIFIHVCTEKTKFTQGCIALKQSSLIKLLNVSGPRTRILIRS